MVIDLIQWTESRKCFLEVMYINILQKWNEHRIAIVRVVVRVKNSLSDKNDMVHCSTLRHNLSYTKQQISVQLNKT